MTELEIAIEKWDRDRIDLDPKYVEPIMEAARAWREHLKTVPQITHSHA